MINKAIGIISGAFLLVLNPVNYAIAAEAELDLAAIVKANTVDASDWELVNRQPLLFDSHHPQGLVKIDEHFFLSSVETLAVPTRFETLQGGHDRTTGSGIGHLFKFTESGELVADLQLGEGSMYHPGGLDFDGSNIWISVAEYRPNSQSIVYKIEHEPLTAKEEFRFADHLGGILRDPDTDTLFGVSWGSRRFYRWQGFEGSFTAADVELVRNSSFYIDYQDCQWLPKHMLCSGIQSYRNQHGRSLKLGGIELIALDNLQPSFQLPVTRATESGTVLTQNPFFFETNERGDLLFHFVPEDNSSTLYTFKASK